MPCRFLFQLMFAKQRWGKKKPGRFQEKTALTANDRAGGWKELLCRCGVNGWQNKLSEHLSHMVSSKMEGKNDSVRKLHEFNFLFGSFFRSFFFCRLATAEKKCWKIFLVHFTCLSFRVFVFLVVDRFAWYSSDEGERRAEKNWLSGGHGWSKILIDQTAILPVAIRRSFWLISPWLWLDDCRDEFHLKIY